MSGQGKCFLIKAFLRRSLSLSDDFNLNNPDSSFVIGGTDSFLINKLLEMTLK